MNASTPSSSSSSPVPAPLAAPVRRRTLPPFVRPILSCGGAILLGGVLLRLFSPAPVKEPLNTQISANALSLMVLSKSQLMTARLAPLAPRTLQGEFHFATDVTGRAPVSGEVARQLANVGSYVQAGDRVLEVSSGAVSRPVPVAEVRQNRAEREQVSVVKSQGALAQQLSTAQNQLALAQERVAAAKERVASTNALVKRLLAGEQIPAPGGLASPTPRKRKRRKIQIASPLSSRAQSRAEEALSGAKNSLEAAQSERDEARRAIAGAKAKVDSSKAALERAETDFKAEKTTADVLQNARSEADDAANALQTAQARADVADKALASRQSKVETAQALAQKGRDEAKRAPAPEEAPDSSDDEPQPQQHYLTPDQAGAMVASAVRESKSATRTAERIRARVNDYQRQVSSTSQRREEASKDLHIAQQQVLDTAPLPVLTVARAPRSGTITWMSRLAREVSTGQSVFGISQGRNGFLRFEDKGNAWKSLQVGQTLNAAPAPTEPATMTTSSVQPPASKPDAVTVPSSAAPSAPATVPAGTIATSTSSSTSSLGASVAVFSVRLTRITPPKSEGEAALIDAVVLDPGALPAGADAVQVQLPSEAVSGKGASTGLAASPTRPVVVPTSVVLPRDGVNYIAVMSPNSTTDASTADAKPITLSWRRVQVARQTAFDVELRAGVRDGEEIVNQPALLLSQWKPEDKKPFPVLIDASG